MTSSDQFLWVEVAMVAEVPWSGVLAIELGGQSVLLCRLGSQVVCYENACSHLQLPLDFAKVQDGALICPHHGFRFDLKEGHCLNARTPSLKQYPVEIRNDRVFVRQAN